MSVESNQSSKSFKLTTTTTTSTYTNNNSVIDLEDEDEIIGSNKENEQIKQDDDDIIPTTQPLSDEEFDQSEIRNTPVKIIQQLQQQLPIQLLNTQNPSELPFQTTLDDGKIFVCFDKKIREELQKIEDTNLMIMKMFPNQNIPPLPPIVNIHQLTAQTTTTTTASNNNNNNNNNNNSNNSKSTTPQKQNNIPTPTTTTNKSNTISVSPSPPPNRTNSVIPISPSPVKSILVNNTPTPQKHPVIQNIDDDDDTEEEKTVTEEDGNGFNGNNYNRIGDEGYNDKRMKDGNSNNLSNALKRASSVEYLGENDGSGNSNNYNYNNNNNSNNNNNNNNNKKLKNDNDGLSKSLTQPLPNYGDADIKPTSTPTTPSPNKSQSLPNLTKMTTKITPGIAREIAKLGENPYNLTSFGTPIVYLEALLRIGPINPTYEELTDAAQQLTNIEIRDKVRNTRDKGDDRVQQYLDKRIISFNNGICTLTETGRLLAIKTQPYLNEHREFKRINDTNFNHDTLGQNKVMVVYDSNEFYKESLRRNFQEIGLPCIEKGLPAGDFLFIKNNIGVRSIENNNDIQFYPFLFERKTWKDLNSSQKDIRNILQGLKMKACHRIKRLFYIIEGEQDTGPNSFLPMQDLKKQLDQNSFAESFSIIRTNSLLDTTKQLAMIAKMLADGIIPVHTEDLVSFREFKQAVDQSKIDPERAAAYRDPTKNAITNSALTPDKMRFQITSNQFKEYMISAKFRELVYQRLKHTLDEKKILVFDSYADLKKELVSDHNKLFKAWQKATEEGKNTSRLGYRCRTLLRCKYLEVENLDYSLLHLIFKFNLHVMTTISVSERNNLESFTTESEELKNVFELPLKPLYKETVAIHVPDSFDSNDISPLN